jgi:hypothetical protein
MRGFLTGGRGLAGLLALELAGYPSTFDGPMGRREVKVRRIIRPLPDGECKYRPTGSKRTRRRNSKKGK